jgi:hypothetical protein
MPFFSGSCSETEVSETVLKGAFDDQQNYCPHKHGSGIYYLPFYGLPYGGSLCVDVERIL